jgi:hypothetical protein
MELDMAMVEEMKYKENKEDEEFDKVLNMDRDITKGHITVNFEEYEEYVDLVVSHTDIVKGHTTTFEFKEDEEFAKVFYTTTFKFEENEEFDKVFNNTTFEFKENEEDEEFDKVFHTDEFEQDSDHQEVPIAQRRMQSGRVQGICTSVEPICRVPWWDG